MVNVKFKFSDYEKILKIANEFRLKNKRNPNYILYNGYKIMKINYEDAINRVNKFHEKMGRWPGNVLINVETTTVAQTPKAVSEWAMTPHYKYDKQDTCYTCGPTSFEMLISEFGLTISESQLAKRMGTGKGGTGHQGILRVAKELGLKAGVKYIKDLTLNDLAEICTNPKKGAMFHFQVRNEGVARDNNGKLIYRTYRGGHYEYLIGVNENKKLIKVADPDRQELVYPFSRVKVSLRATESQGRGSILIFEKP